MALWIFRTGTVLFGCGLIAVAGYIYPRPSLPDIISLVPSESLACCVRVRGLSRLWKRFSETAFARSLRAGEIHPIREKMARDEEFEDDWKSVDLTYLPEVFGRDCVVALYMDGGKQPRIAAWSRIGFMTRAFHFFERLRTTLLFWREPRVVMKRIGGLRVGVYLDGRTGVPRCSYLLRGDLAVATVGDGGWFWPSFRRLLEGDDGTAFPGGEALLNVVFPHEEDATGAFLADVARLEDSLLSRIGTGNKNIARLREAVGEYERVQGVFNLGPGTTAVIDLVGKGEWEGRETALPAHNVSSDPLAGLVGKGGILYAGGSCDIPGIVESAREDGMKKGVRIAFIRQGGRDVFPADHFDPTWLGDDCSFLLYGGKGGIVHAAASFALSDPRLASLRLSRFAALTDGARVRMTDGSSRILFGSRDQLEVKAYPHDGTEIYMVRAEEGWGRFFAPVCTVYRGRLLVASSQSLLFLAMGENGQPGAEWAEPGSFHAVFRGTEAERAAASTRQILSIGGLFVRDSDEKERIRTATSLLGYSEWLAPVKEIRISSKREDGLDRVKIGADFVDSPDK